MSRILVTECRQEVSSFNPVPSCLDDFNISRGDELFRYHRSVRDEVGGALSVFDQQPELELIPTMGARANTSGGPLEAESHDRLMSELLQRISEAGPVDAAYFALHGAMESANELDPEGYLLQEARKILGEDIPFVTSLDLHGILTDRMLQHSDAVVCYHTYPHVDFFETGSRSAALLLRILAGDVKPVTARVKIPALVRGDELITESGSIRHCIELAKEVEQSDRGLSAGVMWGNPFTDVPELRTNSLAVFDGDMDAARQAATELASRFWQHHEKMCVPLTSLHDAAQQTSQTNGTVVLMDAADATSSGASGDSNAILAELIRIGFEGSTLSPVVDPAAVRMAFEAGVGATIKTTVGGALDPARYTPLPIEAKVRSLSDGRFQSESFGWHWNSGDTAILQVGKHTIVVGTRPVSLFDRSWFYANGQDPKRFDAVVVKSPHCEPHMFADWCSKLINVDAPGATSANLLSLGHRVCARPVFPLDDIEAFTPEVEIYQRP